MTHSNVIIGHVVTSPVKLHQEAPISTCTYFCSVSDTLDDVLKISKEKPKRKPKPAINTKPLGLSLFDEEDTSANLSKMGTDDITKYIQQNQSKDDDDDLDLFK